MPLAPDSVILLVCNSFLYMPLHTADIVSDDSYLNCAAAYARGWHTVHLVEPGVPEPPQQASKYQISHLKELHTLFPQFLKHSTTPFRQA